MTLHYFEQIDELLGHRQSRYFGEGYLRTDQSLSDFRIADQGDGLAFTCVGAVSMPDLWSAKDGKVQTPHLSTIDVLELAQQCLQCMLRRTFHRQDVSVGIVDRIDIVAGSEPVETALDAIPIEGRIVQGDPSDVMTVRIANMVVTIAFSTRAWPSDRKIGDGKQALSVAEVMLHPAAMRASGVVHPAAARAGEAWSTAGCFAAGLQLGQALLYTLDDIDRGRSNTLWMKRTSVTFLPITPEVGPSQPIVTRLGDARRYPKADGEWRRADIHSFVANMAIVCSVTHRLPSVPQ